jgi:hypothetical protein
MLIGDLVLDLHHLFLCWHRMIYAVPYLKMVALICFFNASRRLINRKIKLQQNLAALCS